MCAWLGRILGIWNSVASEPVVAKLGQLPEMHELVSTCLGMLPRKIYLDFVRSIGDMHHSSSLASRTDNLIMLRFCWREMRALMVEKKIGRVGVKWNSEYPQQEPQWIYMNTNHREVCRYRIVGLGMADIWPGRSRCDCVSPNYNKQPEIATLIVLTLIRTGVNRWWGITFAFYQR